MGFIVRGIAWQWTWTLLLLVGFLVIAFILCAIVCTIAEREIGLHDAPAIILDEVWAMAAVVILGPWWTLASWYWFVGAFLLFRAFDILKPFPLNWLERLPGGWGIMADDLGAAAYTITFIWCVIAAIVLFFASHIH